MRHPGESHAGSQPGERPSAARVGVRGWLNLGLAVIVVVLVTLKPFSADPVVTPTP